MSLARSTWLTCVLAIACGCDAGPSEARRLQAQAAPFLDDFASFDRWARRFGAADSAFHSREGMREAVFAPLHERRRVAAAWLVREGPDAAELRHPDGAPAVPEDGWVRVVISDHELTEIYAQRRTMTVAGEAREVTLIRRSRPAPGDATLHVVMAF